MPFSISLDHAPDHVLGALRHVPPVCGRKVVVALLDLAKERRLGVRLECEKQLRKCAVSEHHVQDHTHS